MLDLGLPDMTGMSSSTMKSEPTMRDIPIVIVYTGGTCRGEEQTEPASAARRGDHRQGRELPDRLLDETALFLHRVGSACPSTSGRCSAAARVRSVLAGKHVLIVDDDMRNIFALTSVLERHKMKRDVRGERQGRHRTLRGTPRHRHGAHGHHDAGDGRLRSDAAHPQRTEFKVSRSSPSPRRR